MSVSGRWTFKVEGAVPESGLLDETEQWEALELSATGAELTKDGLKLGKDGWAVARPQPGASFKVSEKTLIVWVQVTNLADKRPAGSAFTLDAVKKDQFDGIVLGEHQDLAWEAGSSNLQRTEQANPANPTATGALQKLAVTYKDAGNGDATMTLYCGDQLLRSYTKGKLPTWSSKDMEVVFGARHTLVEERRGHMNAIIVAAEVHDECLTLDALKLRHQDFSQVDYHHYATAVTDLKVLLEDAPVPAGYTRLPTDLNKGTDGKLTHLAVQMDPAKQDPRHWITGVDVIGSDAAVPAGWTKDPQDLNAGAGGHKLYLVFKRGGDGRHPIKDLQVIEERYTGEFTMGAGYRYVPQDLNGGAGGAWLYLAYRKTLPNITDVTVVTKETAPADYELIRADLNATSGEARWLAFKRDAEDQNPDNWVTDLMVLQGDASPPAGWIKNTTNLNADASALGLFLAIKKGGGTPVKDVRVVATTGRPVAYTLIDTDLNSTAPPHPRYVTFRKDDQHELAVDLIGQKTKMWCWAASGEMIMSYLGHDQAQCEQANKRYGGDPKACEILEDPTATSVQREGITKGGWPEFDKWGFTAQRTSEAPLSFAQLKSEIDANRPVAFSWGWRASADVPPGGGHMMIVIGYREAKAVGGRTIPAMVCVNDPWPVNQGDYSVIPYADYMGRAGKYTHWDDFYAIAVAQPGAPHQPGETSPGPHAGATDLEGANGAAPAFGTPDEAAADTLAMLPALVTPDNFAKLGLAQNVDDASGLSLGKSLPVQHLLAADVARLADGMSVHEVLGREALGEVDEYLFAVHEYDGVALSIAVRRDDDGFRFHTLGRANFVNAVHAAYERHRDQSGHDHEAYFLVHLPHVYHMLLGHYEDDELFLTTILEVDELGIPAGETLEAQELIEGLFPTIHGHEGALV